MGAAKVRGLGWLLSGERGRVGFYGGEGRIWSCFHDGDSYFW